MTEPEGRAGGADGGLSCLARAKVNLTLHVTGQRADGYHLLDSLVVFPEIGDCLHLGPGASHSLSISGDFAPGLRATPDNLILQAARMQAPDGGGAFHLIKNLPIAAGIGGGSADAAAAARLLARRDGRAEVDLLGLGADIPACQLSRPLRMRGIGDALEPVPELPSFWMILVNSGQSVPTGPVFAGLSQKNNPAMGPLPQFSGLGALVAWLDAMRNDLQGPACRIAPDIADVLAAIDGAEGCLLARMSGSGGTCFGIFAAKDTGQAASRAIQAAHPDWWCAAAAVTGQP